MVALRAGEVDAYVARPDPTRPVALVFGPDAGLVSERAPPLVRVGRRSGDPFALVRLDGDELAGDPSRLIDEAHTIPLFGGRRAVWVKAGSRELASAVEALIAVPIRDCRVVIEAGDLRRNAPLRVVCERAAAVAAIACYLDGERDLGRLIDEEMRSAGLSIAPDARAALLPLLGGDRRASRNEVRKLALYARGNARVELDDVAAVVADASALVLDNVIDAAFAGRASRGRVQGKAREAGITPGRIVSAALLQVGQLHRARLAIEGGLSVPEAGDQIVRRPSFAARGDRGRAARMDGGAARARHGTACRGRAGCPAAVGIARVLGRTGRNRVLLAIAGAATKAKGLP